MLETHYSLPFHERFLLSGNTTNRLPAYVRKAGSQNRGRTGLTGKDTPTASLTRDPLASQYLLGERIRAGTSVSVEGSREKMRRAERGAQRGDRRHLFWPPCLPERLLGEWADQRVGESLLDAPPAGAGVAEQDRRPPHCASFFSCGCFGPAATRGLTRAQFALKYLPRPIIFGPSFSKVCLVGWWKKLL